MKKTNNQMSRFNDPGDEQDEKPTPEVPVTVTVTVPVEEPHTEGQI